MDRFSSQKQEVGGLLHRVSRFRKGEQVGAQKSEAALLDLRNLRNLWIHVRFFRSMSGKVLSQVEMLGEREGLRAAGQRLVFTNGVFDLLHVGHVRYLAAARALGDLLLVAINSDRSVRALKGPGRPVVNENERAELLVALESVAYVVVFDDISPRSLIASLLPDVLVKGGDYQLNEIHGREEVEAAGGKVITLPFIEGSSTSGIIERMRRI